MREMWELPGRSAKDMAIRTAVVVALVWALIAVPLTAWLVLRDPEVPAPPQLRELSVMEQAAVTNSGRALLHAGYVEVRGQVTTPTARFTVTQTVQTTSGDSIGKVTSGSESADLLVASNTTYLRGNAAFWSTVGVPTSFGGWVEVGTTLGGIAFSLNSAIDALRPGPAARVVTAESDKSFATYRTDQASAKFSQAGISSITYAGRTVDVGERSDDVGGPLAAARSGLAGAGKLAGTSGALTVSEPPRPAPKPGPGSAAGNP